jgi:hypothetical protein
MSRAITDTAVLIGLSPEGKCVYSESIPLGEYWDGDHAWDDGATVISLRLEKLKGYLFDDAGELFQEFESTFDLANGVFLKGWARHADGTFQEHKA